MAKKSRGDGTSEKKGSKQFPVPSHLVGWVVPTSFENERLTATLRCPCSCERFEFHHPGVTVLHQGRPYPTSAKIDELWYYIIKAVCTCCRQERVLFDSHLHGNADFLGIDPNTSELDPPRLWRWHCLECGSAIHTGETDIVSDYKDRYFEYGYAERFGADRWRDAFGWFSLSIKCCGCGYDTSEWAGYETR